MNCRKSKKLIFEFVDGLVDERDRITLEQHLVECAECEQMAKSLSRSLDLLHRAPMESPSDNFEWKVKLRLNRERRSVQENSVSLGRLIRTWNLRYAMATAASFAAVVLVGALVLNDNAPTRQPEVMEVVASDDADARMNKRSGKFVKKEDSPAKVEEAGRTSVGGIASPAPAQSMMSLVTEDRSEEEMVGPKLPPVIDQSRRPIAVDFMISSDLETMEPEEAINYLQSTIQSLQTRLDQYEAMRAQPVDNR